MDKNHLKIKILNGIKWSSYSSLIVAVIQFITIMILARFLEKKEMGQIAIIQTLVGITIIFLDMGISNAIVHKRDISEKQLSSVYWVNVFSGVFFSLIIYFLSDFIAMFYKSPQLSLYIKYISITFIILSLSRLYKFLFIKKMHLKEIALSEIISYSIAFICLIYFLKIQLGVFSFIYFIIIRSVIQSFYLLWKGLRIFKPLFTYDHKSLKEFFNYGLFNLGQNLVVYFNSQLDTILIGRLLGFEVLGVYSIAKNLASKPLQLISPVISKITFPLMSEIQFKKEKLKDIYIKSITYLFSVVIIIYTVIILESEDIINILYKNKWQDAVLLLQLLSIYYTFNAIGNPIGSLILATGKVKEGFLWNVLMLLIIPMVIYFSSFYGIQQIIISLIIFQMVTFVMSFKLITQKIIKLRLVNIFMPLIRIVILVVPSVLVILWLKQYITNIYIRVLLMSVLGLFLYIFSIFKFHKEYFIEIKNNIKI